MKFDFPNSQGEMLSGRLELPVGTPKAYALFAHCFTCSKDIIAPNIISKTLTNDGVAVLRFDFTGLGNSQGDFANTNFSSNVDDLLSACKHLGKQFEHPELLIGHSLGGAAVLQAAAKIPSVRAVATIGAPSSIDHVKHLFSDDIEQIEKEGQGHVKLAGREFTIKKQFIDDLSRTDILDKLSDLKKALLIMHSPVDNMVSIDHASNIFVAAKHPKSFVTLDNADHLLMKKEDARYVAGVIGSWALRYLSIKPEAHNNVEQGKVLVKNRTANKFTQDIYTSDHQTVADEPFSLKGDNLGMNPYQYLLAGLGSCTSMTLKMYAERKGIDLKNVSVELDHKRIHAEDCEACESLPGKIDVIRKKISIEGNISPEQKQRLYEIAEMCPVNKTLGSEIKIETETW